MTSEGSADAFDGANFPQCERDGKIFLDVCALDELPRKSGKAIFFDDETQVAIFRIAEELYAVSHICPHQHVPILADGLLDDLTVTCPLHGWMYSLENGKALGGGAKLKTYKVFEEGGRVWLEQPKRIEPDWIMDF